MGYLVELDPPSPPRRIRAPRPAPVASFRPDPALPQEWDPYPLKKRPRIELDTPIVPVAVAIGVWEEACAWLDEELPRHWIARLTERANVIYQHNAQFRQLLRGRGTRGRDALWAFTRHWLCGLIWEHRPDLDARLPDSYSSGRPLRHCGLQPGTFRGVRK